MTDYPNGEFIEPFGISADTGRPFQFASNDTAFNLVHTTPEVDLDSLRQRSSASNVAFAVDGDFDANDLAGCGWGIIFGPGVDQKIKDALKPLIDHRKAMASPFKVYDGAASVQPGESAATWLSRHVTRLDVVNPAKGVPFYLLIIAPPGGISFDFQYSLDIYWAVGRLWFDTPDAFARYAENVVRHETEKTAPTTRNVTLFAPEHDFDAATQLFTRNVVKPLAVGEGNNPLPLGKRQHFEVKTVCGRDATKASLSDLLRGKRDVGTPTLLFSGSHGMEFRFDDPKQASSQGAIVCQDWVGYGKITEDHWFGANDIPSDAQLSGLIHIFFACHGGGCTEFDDFDRLNGDPRKIASAPFLSQLPSKLLAHPNGALAVFAHVERAWAYSFMGDKGGSQCQAFRDIIARLLRGDRIGQATDVFNIRWAALSTDLADLQNDARRGLADLKTLNRLWIARDDARNFIILGDPAVRPRPAASLRKD